jgi:protein-L-isoaspartate(D-aspartate) O-methyltransferase
MRRAIKTGVTALLVALVALPAMAQFKPLRPDQSPPMDSKENYITWMKANRGESEKWLSQRWDRFVHVVRNKDAWTDKTKRAFLLTPREVFAAANPAVAARGYDHAFLDMGYGVTMSGPHLQTRMTEVIDVKRGDKVLEIGTGSGTQSGFLSELTDQVYTIEIIAPLAARTRGIYDKAIAAGYEEFKNIHTKQADGYYGWQEAAPFDKIIVTTGIDHIPPPLLQQLKPGGIMVIPVGPPGAQRVLKVTKQVAADGAISVTREDIYGGKIVPFVPFTKLVDGHIKGTHNK